MTSTLNHRREGRRTIMSQRVVRPRSTAVAGILLCGLASVGQPSWAQATSPTPSGTITVQIDGPADGGLKGGQAVIIDNSLIDDTQGRRGVTVFPSKKWVGVVCGPVDDLLRAHIAIPHEGGLAIEQVVPGSPAERMGLRKYDILIFVDEKPLLSTSDLVEAIHVRENGALLIEWLRGGDTMKGTVAPVDRPDVVPVGEPRDPSTVVPDQLVQKWIEELRVGQPDRPLSLRVIGPGMVADAPGPMPKNLNIQVTKNGDAPANITVKRDGETWQLTESDLDQLPEDVRPHVRRMLGGQQWNVGPADDIDVLELEGLPWERLRDRFDRMDRQMEKMLERMERIERFDADAPAEPPSDVNLENDA